MPNRDGILILTASTGAGHLVAAAALEQALRLAAPAACVQVVDVLVLTNRFFRGFYAGGYLGIVRHAPAAMGWLYDWMDRPEGRLRDRLRAWIQDCNKLPIVRYIQQWRPRLIVNTHYLPAELVAQMRRAGRLDCPQAIVTTDYQTHRIWVQQPAERYYTATEEGKFYLATCGAPAERILVSGIPVRPGFEVASDRDQVRRRCGLDPDCPVVLLLCGGFGVGPVARLLAELLAMPCQAQLVVIAGRNEKLRRRLEDVVAGVGACRFLDDRGRRRAWVIGFTDQVHVWMQAADLVVTKPGGLTVAEALACGLPLVIVNPIPGQETRNSDYLLECGAAIKVDNPRLLGYRVGRLLGDPQRLACLRAAAQACGRPRAAADIAADLLNLLSQSAL